MKVLVVFVVAVFTAGCNADLKSLSPSTQQVEMAKEAFWDAVAKATATAEESMKQIRESELGQDLNTLIASSSKTLSEFADSLHSKMSPLTQDLVSTFHVEAERLRARLDKDLPDVRPLADQMMANLLSKVEELKKEAETMDADVLLQKSKELKEQLDQGMEQLQTLMGPYAVEMKEQLDQRMDQIQTQMAPLAEEMKQKLQGSLDQFQRGFEAQIAQKTQELRAKLASDSQNVKAQLMALWDTFSKLSQSTD